MTVVSVLVPFKPDGGERDRIWNWMRQRWLTTMPGIELVVCSDGSALGEPFNEGKAWNACARQASGEIFVITESEVAFNPASLRLAIDEVHDEGGWQIPAEYHQLGKAWTEYLLGRDPTEHIGSMHKKYGVDRSFIRESVSPIWVLPREALDKVGGFPEDYRGWGWIDKAFAAAMNTLYEPYERYPGSVYHLDHPRTESKDCNSAVTRRYLDAAGDPVAMREIINAR